MKPRTVIVTLELETNWTVSGLKAYINSKLDLVRPDLSVRQMTITIAQPVKAEKAQKPTGTRRRPTEVELI